ncbi:hypothetical protein CQW23_16789 [Capsicum baccatum]|uniref:Uncharacterized protein n=1 Tax=Capsicum baccatum TaxID=33114 RepID=A0A2G2WBY5_CAPBA|nr:hypothetical protein CQW23_16789 [Capsicum baccatum]
MHIFDSNVCPIIPEFGMSQNSASVNLGILQKYTTFGEMDTHRLTFLKSPSNMGHNKTQSGTDPGREGMTRFIFMSTDRAALLLKVVEVSTSKTVSLLTESGNSKNDLRLPTDNTLLALNLIDLAGSESSKNETTGLRRKEGSYINKSLLTLGTDWIFTTRSPMASGEFGIAAQLRGDHHCSLCIIPVLAYGTNPTSATMCGMKIVVVEKDAKGNINIDELRKAVEANKDKLATLMVTYPSKHGVYEEPSTREKAIEGHGVIKKGMLTFEAKFWWLLIIYQLFLIALNNLLTWEGATLVASMMSGYAIDFIAILQHEIHDREFGETINMPFPCMIQRLNDKDGVPELPRVDKRVHVMATMQINIMKDLACPGIPRKSREPAAVPLV